MEGWGWISRLGMGVGKVNWEGGVNGGWGNVNGGRVQSEYIKLNKCKS